MHFEVTTITRQNIHNDIKTHPKFTALPKFIKTLYNMIEEPSTNAIICWAGKNPGFRILDKEAFEENLLQRYF